MFIMTSITGEPNGNCQNVSFTTVSTLEPAATAWILLSHITVYCNCYFKVRSYSLNNLREKLQE